MAKNDQKANLDSYEMQNRLFDAEHDAQRVVLVTGSDIKVEVDNGQLLTEMTSANDKIVKYLDELVKESRKEEPTVLPQVVMVPKVEIKEIEKPVYITETKIVEVEKRVEVPVYKTIEVPIITERIVKINEGSPLTTQKFNQIIRIIQTLVMFGVLIVQMLKK
jgi:hypothetical protein